MSIESLAESEWTEKAALAEEKTVRRNGQVMSVVASRRESDNDDLDTGNFENNCIWTAYYTAAECYRYKVNGDLAARVNAQRSMRTLLQLEEIPRKPGLIARGFKRQLNETWDEAYFWRGRSGRGPDGKPKSEWHADFANDIRFLTDPSKGQLEGWLFGLCEYYDLLADENEKGEIRDAVSRVIGEYLKNNFEIHDLDGQPTQYGTHSELGLLFAGNKLRVLGILKRAHHITGEERFKKTYDHFAKEKGWLGKCVGIFHGNRRKLQDAFTRSFHNSDHLEMLALEGLAQYEHDPELEGILRAIESEADAIMRYKRMLPFRTHHEPRETLYILQHMTADRVVKAIAPKPMPGQKFDFQGRTHSDYAFNDEFEWRRDPRFGISYLHPEGMAGQMRFPAVDFIYAYWKMRRNLV
ncbi:hypothetical protein HYW83_01495 [Candidatus Peregrinibacteria bacterium]|nr:hypothetical protein [Candidatus Peregrinibacteria bacterium]